MPFIIIAVLFYCTVVAQNYVTTTKPTRTSRSQVDRVQVELAVRLRPHGSRTRAPGEAGLHGRLDRRDPGPGLPANENVRFRSHSNDVIHSFWVPEFLFKRDVFPARDEEPEQPVRVHRDVDGQLRRALRRAVRDLPLADELRGAGRLADELPALPRTRWPSSAPTTRTGRPRRSPRSAQAPVATTTHPFDTDRTLRAPSEPQAKD